MAIVELCPRYLALVKPGMEIPGVVCRYTFTGSVPCTGPQVCVLCGQRKPEDVPTPPMHYCVTSQVVLDGEVEESQSGLVDNLDRLSDAIKCLRQTRTNLVDGVQAIEPDQVPAVHPRSVTVYNGPEFDTGAFESRTLHFNRPNITASSARRIARACGVSKHYFPK